MWGFDERGFMMGRGEKDGFMISRVRVKTPRRAQDGNRGWECISAREKRLPTFYIYAGVAYYVGWHRDDIINPQMVFA